MKKNPSPLSLLLNLRVLLGLLTATVGSFPALLAFGILPVHAQQKKNFITDINLGLLPPGFDCAQIHDLGIDRMENFRAGAIMIACGEAEGGSPGAGNSFAKLAEKLLPIPLAYGTTDVDLVTGTETFAHVTQSETFTMANPDNPNQIVVTYNDSRTAPSNYSGASISSDGGNTFARLNPNPFSSGHGTNFGDPVTLYNKPTSTFFAIFLASGCGGQGIGAWTSTDGGNTWSVGACVHTGSSDDRESGWADNNPSSPHYGNMYVTWNNFSVGGGAGFVTVSTDNGSTWTPHQLNSGSPFIRNVQVTGDPATGDVYVAGMNEGGGGFPHNDNNLIYRSTDGGSTWTNAYTGPSFPGPGVTAVGYFACMFSDSGGYWRHEGWGEPAAFNGFVHLVYAQHGTGSDPGDVYYIRSTDMGVTFSAPFKLNSDATTRPQWQPNISVSPAGTLFAVWYDARESASCSKGNPAVPCYRMWARKSTDNGATWLPDDTFSDIVSPLPGQPDTSVQATYAGDYDYGSAILTKHFTSWDDGRVTISSQSQQDAFTDQEPSALGTPSPTPTASPTPSSTPTATATPVCTPQYGITQIGGSIVPGTTDTGNHTDDGTTFVSLPFNYMLYDQTFSGINVSSNGNAQFTTTDTAFSNVCLPWTSHGYSIFPYWDDLRTDANTGCAGYPGGTCGIYTSVSGTAPNRIFNIEWRAVYFANNTLMANYELRFYEGQTRFDVVYGTVASGTTSATAGVQRDDGNFTQYFCNGTGGAASGGQSYTLQGCASPTPTATPTATFTPTPTATFTPTPTATATATATATFTPTATATATPIATATFTPTPTATFTPTPTATAMFTPTSTPTATATATATPTATATATFTPTATATATATATPTATARPTPTPRTVPTPRGRPTPAPRP
ncbi:MAG: sialidase family protein [Alphaproteobacteria bacterium]